jgi:flagellar biosynthesis/type III secretory pathway chaperone
MESQACRDHLATLLSEEVDSLGQLEELLQREHEVLGARDPAAIEHAAHLRAERVGALARVEEQRRSLCTLHGYSPDKSGLESLMIWCDPQGSLLQLLRECAQRAIRCRNLNDRNGVLVAARMKHVEARLAVLSGRTNTPVTYGPNGSSEQTPRRGRVLGAA